LECVACAGPAVLTSAAAETARTRAIFFTRIPFPLVPPTRATLDRDCEGTIKPSFGADEVALGIELDEVFRLAGTVGRALVLRLVVDGLSGIVRDVGDPVRDR
jgi:hypothetical protein